MKRLLAIFLSLSALPVLADGRLYGYDYTYDARPSEPPSYPTYAPEPKRYDIIAPDGTKIGTGQVDSSGRMFSDQTGRPIGRYRQ